MKNAGVLSNATGYSNLQLSYLLGCDLISYFLISLDVWDIISLIILANEIVLDYKSTFGRNIIDYAFALRAFFHVKSYNVGPGPFPDVLLYFARWSIKEIRLLFKQIFPILLLLINKRHFSWFHPTVYIYSYTDLIPVSFISFSRLCLLNIQEISYLS